MHENGALSKCVCGASRHHKAILIYLSYLYGTATLVNVDPMHVPAYSGELVTVCGTPIPSVA